MLTAGVLRFDAQGRIVLSTGAAVGFNGGTPMAADGGLASVTGGTPDVFLAAIGYLDNKLTDSTNPLVPAGGPVTNEDGNLRVSNDPPDHWYAGLPITAAGFLSISGGGPPPILPAAFDQGFDNAFDNGSP